MSTDYAPYTATLPCPVPGCGWVAEATRRMNWVYKVRTDKGDEAQRRMVALTQSDTVALLRLHLGHKHLGTKKGWAESKVLREAQPGDYKAARGVVKPGLELPEDLIRRLRGAS